MGASWADQKFFKITVLKCHLILHNNKPFINQILNGSEKWTAWENRQWSAQWLDGTEVPKHFPKPKLHQTKAMVTVWWSAARLKHYGFLIPCENITSEKYAQQINKMPPKLQCLQLAFVNKMGTIFLKDNTQTTCHTSNVTKLECLGYKDLLICHILLTTHQPTTTSASTSTTFFRENASTSSSRQTMLSKISSNPEAWFLHYRNKQTYFSLAKMCWL